MTRRPGGMESSQIVRPGHLRLYAELAKHPPPGEPGFHRRLVR